MTTQIKYTATIDDNPFAAGAQRLGNVLQGIQQRFSQVGRDFTTVGQGMSAQMGQITSSVRGEVAAMGGHFSSLIEAVGRTRLGFVALIGAAAGLAASKAVAATAQMTEGAMDLARVLGTSTNKAQEWRIALQDVGAQQSDLEGAAKGMARQLKENEADMNALGLVTRDAAGNFRPMNELLVDGIDILNQHKEGADRSLASQQLFGRGVDASSKLLLVNKEVLADAKTTIEDLGLEVGENASEAWKEYDAATDRAAFGVQGMAVTVGKILMPVLTDLVNVFNAVMPAAITVVRGAIGGLTSAFHFLKNGVITVWEVINAMVVTVAEPIRALAEGLGRAITGDFSGAVQAIKGIGGTISGAWGNAMDKILESSLRTRARVDAIWSPDSAPGAPEGERGTKTVKPSSKDQKADKQKKEAADPSFMQYYELALAEEKRLASERDALREYTKQQELEFWRGMMVDADLTGRDRLAIARKVSDLTVQIQREEAAKLQQLDNISREQKLADGMYRIELARMEAGARYELGEISAAQLLEQERQLEEKRAEIRRAALMAKQADVDPERDPVAYAQISAQIEEEERQHQLRLGQIRGEVQKAAQTGPMANIWQGVEQSFATAAANMLNRTQTLRQGLATAWQGIRSAITGEIAKIAAARAVAFVRERAEALASIGTNAAKAGSGAASAMSSIPIVGPALAVAAMAAVFAGVMGMSSKVPSAAGGFDIPAGVNPLTQLHEREMVLPADIADPLRSAVGGSGAGMPSTIQVNITSPDAEGVRRLLMNNTDALADALRKARREFQFSGGL